MTKKILVAAMAVMPIFAAAQTDGPFKISGKVAKLAAPAKVYLVYRAGGNNITDSASLDNGTFSFTGRVLEPTSASIFLDRKGLGFERYIDVNFPDGGPSKTAESLQFFLDKEELNITSADSIQKAQISGSKINADNQKLLAALKPITEKAKTLADEVRSADDVKRQSAAFQNSIESKRKVLQTQQKQVLADFITNNPDSYISLLALGSISGPAPEPAEIEPLFNKLSAELRNSTGGQAIHEQLLALKSTAIGATAPDFIQNDVDGKPVKLSSFRGKYVLLDFWASWCGPCRQENPNVVKAYYQFKDKNFTVLGVSLDKPNDKNAWLAAIKSDGLVWTQVSDLKYWNNDAAALYGIHSIPQNYLIDPQGKIVAKNLRGEELEEKLTELLVNKKKS